MKKIIISSLCISVLSACVTQTYEADNETPIVLSEASNNEIAMTRISLGLSYLNKGDTSKAKLNLEKAKKTSPNLVQVHTAFAHYYDSVSEPELAVKSFEKALDLDPQNADTLNNYGVFLCKHAKYKESEEKFLQAIAVPSYLLVSQSYQNLALCQLEAKDYKKAEQYTEKAVLHSPTSVSALHQMMQVQYIKADYKKAATYLKRYEGAMSQYAPDALALAYKIYANQNNETAANKYAALLFQLYPASEQMKAYKENRLQHIPEDDWAEEYRILHAPKKRVVVLSPSKKTLTANTKKPEIPVKTAPPSVEKAATPVMVSTAAAVEPTAQLGANASMLAVSNAMAESKPQQPNAPAKKQPANYTKVPERSVTSTQPVALKRPEDLPEENIKENTDVISVGQVDLEKEKAVEEKKVAAAKTHVVEKGQGLFRISKMYNIRLSTLMKWNDITNADQIEVGDVLVVSQPEQSK
ncbi:type IV pilus biogenesis/stability protein PilW [Thalassotalea agarivorans]|nr:type IV pilus biogenesis/stability protein PilW [Thalassotalea agarivorans]